MDTRLKNNKMALRMAAVIVAAAAACFALVAIRSKYHVNNYYMQHDSDFENNDFIKVLFQWNYVLYPELLEKSGKTATTEELYLSFEEKAVSNISLDEYYGTELIYEGSSEQLKSEYVSELSNNLLRTDSLYTTELGTKLDYCVIDGETQTILKNTARSIELLTEEDNQGYVYYIMIQYDKNGSVSDMRVRSSDSEQLLKNVQLVANSTDSLLLDEKQRTMRYALTNESEVVDTRMTVTQKNPQDATFIYAMTEEQMGNFSWFPLYHYDDYGTVSVSYFIGTYSRELMYERSGVGRWYLLILAVITVLFGFLARYMPRSMADTAGTKRCAELIWMVQWILTAVFYQLVVTFVCHVGEVFVENNFSLTTLAGFAILFAGMFLVFGAWYWCLLSIYEMFRGLRAFIKERSLLYRYWGRFIGFFRKIRAGWRETLAGIDLAKETARPLRRLVILQCLVISLFCCFWGYGILFLICYSFVLYFLLRRYISRIQKGYRNLLQATNAIAQGKFDNAFEGDFGIFESYKEELYQIQGGFRTAVEEEVKSQRMKTELITNVSHDLKTPLTAIITYIDLLKEANITDEQKKSYLETLERKSLRLKVLIEDLFEISKASSGNVKLEPVAVDICNLMREVYLEHEDRMNANGLDMRFDLPEEKIILQLDSQKTYRIFENLYVNITKYSLPGTRVYVQAKVLTAGEPKIHIELKNISAQELTVSPTDLTERFVRGDASRNTEGSGLGLAIARSFTELQSGRFGIEIDGDLFKVVIEWAINKYELVT